MERLSIQQCKALMSPEHVLSDDDTQRLRDLLYDLADVIADAFVDLESIDPSLFEPSGHYIDDSWIKLR